MDAMIQRLAQELERPAHQVENVVHLIDEGNTIPFIARYRKELHGSMDDQLLRQLAERLQYLRNLEARKEEVRSAIEGQGKLNCRLKAALAAAETLAEVEDLYRPYKPKRRTRATIAREKGLAPLAEQLSARGGTRRKGWRRSRTPSRGPATSWRNRSPTTLWSGRNSGSSI